MIPEGKIGKFRIKHRNGYPALYEGRHEWTIDLPGVNATQQFAVDGCFGRVLVGGLGTGWVVEQLAKKPNVTKIRVVEIAQEVIGLVWPFLDTKDKGECVCADIWEYIKQPRDVDTVYIDTYNNAGQDKQDNIIKPMRKLVEKWLDSKSIFFWSEK